MDEETNQEKAQLIANSIVNQPIYDKLLKLDMKSIRAIREGNQELLAKYEAEAVLLRAQLLPT